MHHANTDQANANQAMSNNHHSGRPSSMRWKVALVVAGVTAGSLGLAGAASASDDAPPSSGAYHSFGVRW